MMLLFFFLWPHPQHKFPLEVKSEQKLLAYTTATATQDLSCICDLHHSSQQHWILNPLCEARDQTHILMDTSQALNPLSHKGNSSSVPLSAGCRNFPGTHLAERQNLKATSSPTTTPPLPASNNPQRVGQAGLHCGTALRVSVHVISKFTRTKSFRSVPSNSLQKR